MNSRTALMFAAAVLLIVANMVDREGQVSKIASMDKQNIRQSVETVSQMDGFSGEDEIGPQLGDEERDERALQANAQADRQPQISDFSWDDRAPDTLPVATDRTVARTAVSVRNTKGLAPGESTMNFDPRLK